MKLLSMGKNNPKLIKSDKAGLGYLSAVQYFAPHDESGVGNVCTSASPGCISSCLFTAGRGAYGTVQEARRNRTILFFLDRSNYKYQLINELYSFVTKCEKHEQMPAIRLNGTSDIMWEKTIPSLFQQFPTVQFYDYTKHYPRMLRYCDGGLPNNYHLTFSRSENNDDYCYDVLEAGGNVAVVFRDKSLPNYWKGWPIFSGDETDLRFLDKWGVCGLYAKGKARRDSLGFVCPAVDTFPATIFEYED